MRFSYNNNNIKCIDLVIIFIGFESIRYAINLDVLSFMVLRISIICFYRYVVSLNQ